MTLSIKTKRWNDPAEPADGYRLLVCRYRPRGVAKADETWDAWLPQLGPSTELHAAVWGKLGPALSFEEYTKRYVAEMASQGYWIRGFAERLRAGETLTLLCSSACHDPQRCHRTILRSLILQAGEAPTTEARRAKVVRRTPRAPSRA